MVFLLLAIVSSALISILMRLSTARVKGKISMLAFNYLMCLAIGLCYTGVGELFPSSGGLPAALGLGIVNGALLLLGFVMLQYCVGKDGVVLSSIFMKLGLLVPIIISVCVFGEKPSALQLLGFVIAVAAIILINYERGSESRGVKLSLIILLLAGGCCDAMSKIYEELGPAQLSSQYLLYSFAVALLLCVVLMLFKGERPGRAELFFGLVIGVPNYFSIRFLLLSLNSVPAFITYPTYSVATILAVTLAGILIFREKLSRRQALALSAILLALVLLNI